MQRHRVDTKDIRDLLDRHCLLAVMRNAHNGVPKLGAVRLGHGQILPGRPLTDARSDVTHS